MAAVETGHQAKPLGRVDKRQTDINGTDRIIVLEDLESRPVKAINKAEELHAGVSQSQVGLRQRVKCTGNEGKWRQRCTRVGVIKSIELATQSCLGDQFQVGQTRAGNRIAAICGQQPVRGALWALSAGMPGCL